MSALARMRDLREWSPQTVPVDINEIESRIGRPLPSDLGEFLAACAGFEGFFGKSYLYLYGADEFLEINTEPTTAECYPGFLIFGGNGGGEYFAVDTRSIPPRFAMIPCVGGAEDAIDQGSTLHDLLERAEQGDLFD